MNSPDKNPRPEKTPISPAHKLPLTHPDYRYSPARNPYALKIRTEMAGLAYSDNDTETHRGEWRTKFLDAPKKASRRRVLHVELGCNTGHVTRAWAEADPKAAFIGVEWKFKIVYRGIEKTQAKGLKNLLFFRANSERLHYMFGEGEIDHLYLYFPDPWPKKSQWKNRFIKKSTLRDIARVMKPGGVFHIKTDHDGYFKWMEEAFEKVSDIWAIEKKTYDLHAGRTDAGKLEIPEVTLFEKLFIKDGIPIKSVWLKKL